MIVPMIGPSIVPMPPMITANAISAVHCTLNTPPEVPGHDLELLDGEHAAGRAAAGRGDDEDEQPGQARPARPRTAAARSSSRIAVSTRPTRDREQEVTPPMASTATVSAAQ